MLHVLYFQFSLQFAYFPCLCSIALRRLAVDVLSSLPGFLDGVSYGPTGVEYTPTSFTAVNHTHILVTTAPGIGRDLAFSVRVAGQSSSLPPSCIPADASTPAPCVSYAVPTIVDVSPATGPTSGSGMTLVLTGRDFGLLDRMVDVTIVFGEGHVALTVTDVLFGPVCGVAMCYTSPIFTLGSAVGLACLYGMVLDDL